MGGVQEVGRGHKVRVCGGGGSGVGWGRSVCACKVVCVKQKLRSHESESLRERENAQACVCRHTMVKQEDTEPYSSRYEQSRDVKAAEHKRVLPHGNVFAAQQPNW